MIAVADLVTAADVDGARAAAARKRPDGPLDRVRLERFPEGRCAQVLHVGPYRDEGPTVAALHAFIAAVRETFDRLAAQGDIPCLLTNPSIRPFVRSIVERVRPATVVLSQNEIHARARVRALGTIG